MSARSRLLSLVIALVLGLPLPACEGCFYFPGPDAGPGDAGVAPGDLVLNELMSSNQTVVIPGAVGSPDWIEIKNRGAADLSLDGFRLADSGGEGPFVAGVTIPAGGWLVVLANDALDPGTPALPTFPFKLSGFAGDTVTLLDPDGAIVDRIEFGALAADQSFGRLPDGEGAPAPLPFPSPGRANDDAGGEGEGEGEGACVPPFSTAPPLFINEVEVVNTATAVDGEYEPWIELYNASDTVVPLAGLVLADNAELAGAFALPTRSIDPYGFFLVVADEDGPSAGSIPHTTPGLLLSALDDRVVLGDICGTTWRSLALEASTPADTAWGLLPDGDDSGGGQVLGAPTPAAANQ